MSSASDVAAAQRRMAGFKRTTDRMFSRVGNDCLRAGAASTPQAKLEGDSALFEIASDDDEDALPRIKRARREAGDQVCEVGSSGAAPPGRGGSGASVSGASSVGEEAVPAKHDPLQESVLFTKRKMECASAARGALTALQGPKNASKAVSKLVETLGEDHDEVRDLGVAQALQDIDALTKDLGKVPAQTKLWKKASYMPEADKVMALADGVEDALARLGSLAEVLNTIAKAEKQDKTAKKRKERRLQKTCLAKATAKLKGHGFPGPMADHLAASFESGLRYDPGEPTSWVAECAIHTEINVPGSFIGEEACSKPTLWRAGFLKESPDCFGQIALQVAAALRDDGVLEQKVTALRAHMDKNKVKGNNVCFDHDNSELLRHAENQPGRSVAADLQFVVAHLHVSVLLLVWPQQHPPLRHRSPLLC